MYTARLFLNVKVLDYYLKNFYYSPKKIGVNDSETIIFISHFSVILSSKYSTVLK